MLAHDSTVIPAVAAADGDARPASARADVTAAGQHTDDMRRRVDELRHRMSALLQRADTQLQRADALLASSHRRLTRSEFRRRAYGQPAMARASTAAASSTPAETVAGIAANAGSRRRL